MHRFLSRVFLFSALLAVGLIRAMAQDECVMVVEAHSGRILVASNAAEKRPVASLTKIATGVVAVDWALATGTDL
ncbi:MAG TPA: hypothetical protein VLO11_01220, partial [Luteolibacter sp.]|nr:hypothetical protein [Luteolibacter sp.]